MQTIGIVGLGNMGMGMARNLLRAGFAVRGFARRAEVREAFVAAGGTAVPSAPEVARGAAAVFLMVLNAEQVEVIAGEGLLDALEPGAALIVTATIGPDAVRRLARRLEGRGVSLIDAPVSGGKGGADSGTLTLMAAAPRPVLEAQHGVLRAIGSVVVHVGDAPGQGQVAKACLQAFIGVSFEGLFEAMVLGAKAGLDPEVLSAVINQSFAGSKLTAATTGHVVARRFRGTGSHIDTMHKDVGISLDLARTLGTPMPATEVVMRTFDAARGVFPDGDNWCIVELLESMAAGGGAQGMTGTGGGAPV